MVPGNRSSTALSAIVAPSTFASPLRTPDATPTPGVIATAAWTSGGSGAKPFSAVSRPA